MCETKLKLKLSFFRKRFLISSANSLWQAYAGENVTVLENVLTTGARNNCFPNSTVIGVSAKSLAVGNHKKSFNSSMLKDLIKRVK